MSGEEFCGNACRASAIFMYQRFESKICEIIINNMSVIGYCDKNKSSIKIKYDNLIKNVKRYNFSFESYTYVEQDQMTQVVIDEKSKLFIKNPTKVDAERIKSLLNIDNKAVGVIFLDKSNNMIPFIWVKEVNTFYKETACGSGSISCAISLKCENYIKYKIKQPSGSIFKVVFKGNYILFSGNWICVNYYKNKHVVIV